MKKIISIVLASVLVLSLLAACGNQKGEENPKADATVKQPQSNDPGSNITEPSETKPEEQGVTAQRISKISWTMIEDDETYSIVDEYEYDESSNITRWVRYVDDELSHDYQYAKSMEKPLVTSGSYENTWVYSYDANGNLIRYTVGDGDAYATFAYENGELVESAEYWGESCTKRKYNENGDPVESLEYHDEELYRKTVWTYDDTGNLLETESYQNGEISSSTIFQYDENGHLLEEISYENGVISQKTIFDYDENGNQTKRLYYSNDMIAYSDSGLQLKSGYTWEYDSNGNLVAESFEDYEHHALCHSDRYEYTSGGLPSRELHYYCDGSLATEVNCEYDSMGNLLKKIFRGEYGEDLRFTFEYNEDGFLTELEIIEDGQQIVVAVIQFDQVVVSEDRAKELGMILKAWREKIGGFDFEWNW